MRFMKRVWVAAMACMAMTGAMVAIGSPPAGGVDCWAASLQAPRLGSRRRTARKRAGPSALSRVVKPGGLFAISL